MEKYDVVVVGLGVMGAAATYHCAKRGMRVLGIDANGEKHSLGSSHGATRATRETYFESPEYVPLVQRSFDLWRELEREAREDLLTVNGAVYVAPQGHPMHQGVRLAAREHGLPIENMDQKLLADRFPGFSVPDNWEGIFEPRGGVLAAESCLSAYLRLARKSGAVIRHSCSLNEWRNHGGDLKIETAAGPVRADKLILTVGLWACELLADTGLPLTGRRITVAHFETRCPELYSADDLSVYFWATPEGVYAGFPHFDAEGTKIMRHDTGDVCTPKTVRRQVTEADLADVTGFADRYMPGVNGGMRDASACLYTMTPDSHFVVDRHPLEPKVVIATGFSGHGFKFAPVVGEAVADLAVVGSTKLPIGFLSADRFHQNLATDGRKTAAL